MVITISMMFEENGFQVHVHVQISNNVNFKFLRVNLFEGAIK